MGGSAEAPDEDVADGVGGVQFAATGGFGEQGCRVVARLPGVGEGGGQGGPAGLGLDSLRELWQRLVQEIGLPLPDPRCQLLASLAEGGDGVGAAAW